MSFNLDFCIEVQGDSTAAQVDKGNLQNRFNKIYIGIEMSLYFTLYTVFNLSPYVMEHTEQAL